jgi:hypothetical protein
MNKQMVMTALVVYLIISFVPALSLMSLLGRAGGGKKQGGQ